jgi:hypothetical protein
MSKKVFEQHIDFFRVHVFAYVLYPHDRHICVTGGAVSSGISWCSRHHSRNAVLDSADTFPHIIEYWKYLVSSWAAVTAHHAKRCKQLAAGHNLIGSLERSGVKMRKF